MLFHQKKKDKIDVYLPFRLIPSDDGGVDIEAYGSVCCVPVYVTSSFICTDSSMYEDGTLAHLFDMLRNPENRHVRVTVTLLNDTPADGKIDAASLAEIYNDDRFLTLELGGWGMFPYSIYEKTIAEQKGVCL
ncbi:MAG: hypothetical protein IKQ39_01565 [Oscillospiraceae bacterium]|nr:hypothetical protein [Oscillospiraceae bacterium]